MTYFALPPRAAATPCLALVTLLPTLALIVPAQMRLLAAGEPQYPSLDDSSDSASNPQHRDLAVGVQPRDHR
ncbi:hypothetical protein ACFFJ4_22460 [Xanthomonas dyei]|uniref:hypothetical protein n=1 Tax=Xanthomonas dyei TaxID=743699 RepID=UPI0011AFEA7E|nr:hypothetical protein [Xanthomonas dyei]MCC4635850.1 hypothetical protein [Xanthomonas dyei pv. eucalypti]